MVTPARAALARPAPNGASAGDEIVSDATGAVELRIAIAVPPGPGGTAPELALSYSSRNGDGPYGLGWSLELPEIRCSARFGVPDYATCPRYELGDTLLVPGAEAGRYHTLVESFQRIQHGSGGAGSGWTAEQPNGTRLYFGQSASHQIRRNGSTARWLLERTVDPFGNEIGYRYDLTGGEATLAAVVYGNLAAPREIQFLYEARPDPRLSFAGGVERHLTRRVREIRVLSNGAIFRRYAVGYSLAGASQTTGRSLLSWVQEFGTDCTGDDPIADCAGRGLPPRTFRYRDANDVGGGAYSQWSAPQENDAYRIPFGDYAGQGFLVSKPGNTQLIGDIDGNGLPDRLSMAAIVSFQVATPQIHLNTGSGFTSQGAVAAAYTNSFASLEYDQPGLAYQQIRTRAPTANAEAWGWNDPGSGGEMYAMCSLIRTKRRARLAQELYARGAQAHSSTRAQLRASGANPSRGFFEPRPSVKLVDLDADGLADLVVSARLHGARQNFRCSAPDQPLSPPGPIFDEAITVVFRNTGSGWVNDAAAQALANGLPPFEEILVKSSYQTEVDEPASFQLSLTTYDPADSALNPCANLGVWGFEQYPDTLGDDNPQVSTVCNNFIDLAPEFADFDGDGYPDLAVLARDNPNSFWTGADYGYPYDPRPEPPIVQYPARSQVFLQKPGASPRWQRAPQYELPVRPAPGIPPIVFAHAGLAHIVAGATFPCVSWRLGFPDCSPNTYRYDNGVRIADVNRDGLADVVWSMAGEKGVLLNTGAGVPGSPASAWCASQPGDAALVGGRACPGAAEFEPPAALAVPGFGALPITAGQLADLNGDRWLDFVRIDFKEALQSTAPDGAGTDAWIHSPGGSGAGAWIFDPRFDVPIGWRREIAHVYYGVPVHAPYDGVIPHFEVFDVDGDGTADVVGDTNAFLSRARHADLVRAVDNGRGGSLAIEYAAMVQQRSAPLESQAQAPDVPWAAAAGALPLWRGTAVVARVTRGGPNLAPPGDITDYRYAHPRFSRELRSDLGFGLVQRTRSGGAVTEEYFYQDPGRTARTARRLIRDAGSVVHRYEAIWEHVPGAIPGRAANAYLARPIEETSANEVAGVRGSPLRRRFFYDDSYGYDFLTEIHTESASSDTVRVRRPQTPDLTRWIIGLVREQRDEDQRSAWASRSEFVYTAQGRIASELRHRDRGDGSAPAVDRTDYAYDGFGNLVRRVDANGYITAFGYDASGSALTSRTDPAVVAGEPGKVTRWTLHPVLAVPIAVDPGYRDEPRTEAVLDAFGRAVETWLVPRTAAGEGERVLASAVNFEDGAAPPYVERFQFASAALDAIRTAVVDDGFGGVWKTIRDAGPAANGAPRYTGSATYRDPATRRERTTYDLPCAGDDLCRALTGAGETPARVTLRDALDRPVRVDTPRGASLWRYAAAAEPIAAGEARVLSDVDVVWSQNAKGDLTRRSLDGDRVLAVEECTNSDPNRADLAGVSCARSGGPNRTLYAYHASGRLAAVRDPVGVDSQWTSARHQLRYGYDTASLVIAIDDPDAGHSETFYDGVGNAVKTVNARGQERTTSYDALGRRTRIETPEGVIAFAYRAQERRLFIEWSSGYTRRFDYDGFGRVEREVVKGLGLVQAASSRYDRLGRRIGWIARGNTIQHEYAGAFLQRVCAVSVTAPGACSDPSATPIVASVSYDAIGRPSAMQLPGGLRTFAYDGDDTRDLREDKFVGASTLAFEYPARDPLGNVLGWAVDGPAGTDASGTYGYDARNRIASRTRSAPGLPDAAESFAYDPLGNLVSLGGEAQRFEHPTKPHAITSRGAKTYAWDASGNLAQAGGRYFRFDSADRLVCVGSAPGQCDVLSAIYDAEGERVAERAGSTSRIFLGPEQVRTVAPGVDEQRLEITAVGERVAYSVSQISRFAQAPVVFDLEVPPWLLASPPAAVLIWCLALALRAGLLAGVARRPAYAALAGVLVAAVAIPSPAFASGGAWETRTYRWVLSDALGSGLAELDETGRLVRQTRFEPFGGVDDGEYQAAPDPQHRRYFAGHPEQAETGLHYMNARWLDPETGTFLSVDPIVARAGDPQAYNAYTYARNNPIGSADPTGAFDTPLSELQNCNRCSGFAFVPGFYITSDGSSGWITSETQLHTIDPQLGELRSAAGTGDAGSPSVPQAMADADAGVPAPGGGAESAFFTAIGDLAGAAGGAIARAAEILAWDVALALVGILGNAIGVAAGLLLALQGLALLNPAMVAAGLTSSLWALVPRYGFWSGPGWGQPNLDGLGFWFGPFSEQNVIEGATHEHDLHHAESGADRQLIRDVWSRNDLGPYGQVYRLGLSGLFGSGILMGMDD
ncbi:MAG: hypothetical protein E6J87_09175 [Deltaproteobacteria bacterium]|nr:MAG: hypothetical protein E6J87_09175 [Deltaproteobacteria bacterium]